MTHFEGGVRFLRHVRGRPDPALRRRHQDRGHHPLLPGRAGLPAGGDGGAGVLLDRRLRPERQLLRWPGSALRPRNGENRQSLSRG